MQAASSRIGPVKPGAGDRITGLPSPALEWLWKQLADVRRPAILDCGPVHWKTTEILLRRGAKVYLGDVLSPLLNQNQKFWDRSGKVPVFRLADLLAEFPAISPDSLNAAFCWHLFDLLPIEVFPKVLEKLVSFIAPGGVLFFMLRERYLPVGADAQWAMENLKTIVATRLADRPFPYPVLTSREVEKVLPAGSLKVFLTRSGRREVVAMK